MEKRLHSDTKPVIIRSRLHEEPKAFCMVCGSEGPVGCRCDVCPEDQDDAFYEEREP